MTETEFKTETEFESQASLSPIQLWTNGFLIIWGIILILHAVFITYQQRSARFLPYTVGDIDNIEMLRGSQRL